MSIEYPCVYWSDGMCKKFSDDKVTSWCVEGPCGEQIPSNADKIRAMSDEELAQEMIFFCPTDTVFNGTETYEKPHYTGLDGRYYTTSEELNAANLEWLQQPEE